MIGYVADIEQATKSNSNFRTVLYTGKYCQLTVMSIPVGEEIGLEAHPTIDQFVRLEQGQAKLVWGPTRDNLTEEHTLKDDWAAIVPAGTWHNFINTGAEELKLYSIYAPPNHPDGAVHRAKADAEAAEAAEHKA